MSGGRRSCSSADAPAPAGRGGGRARRRLGGLLRALALLLLVGDAARLGLRVAHLAEVDPHGARGEGVGLGRAAAPRTRRACGR